MIPRSKSGSSRPAAKSNVSLKSKTVESYWLRANGSIDAHVLWLTLATSTLTSTQRNCSMHLTLNRRRFLRAAGVSLALPWLDALAPAQNAAAGPPRRMVCICTPLGLHAPNLFPERAGRDYALTPYLDELREFRDDFTIISGL